MATKFDMPTTEGTLALARAVATGAKLAVKGAMLCLTEDTFGTVEDVAGATWDDISGMAQMEDVLPCTSYLPSIVDSDGTDTGTPIAALDLEFTYMPTGELTYDTVAVLADMYYGFAPWVKNSPYKVGDTVWYTQEGGTARYYRCKDPIVSSTEPPQNDPEHWESVTTEAQMDYDSSLKYMTIEGEGPVLLYVSKTSSPITVSDHIEIDYKVRLYLENPATVGYYYDDSGSGENYGLKKVVFDTIGPEFMASAQLNLLANFAEALRHIRDVAVERVNLR